jgi:hypothetical protein
MTTSTGNIAWQLSSSTSPAPDVDHGTISLGTVTVQLSALAVALQEDALDITLTPIQAGMISRLMMYKPLIFQKTQATRYQNALYNYSVSMICCSLKHLDSMYYGVNQGSNSSIPTTQPTETPEESTSPAIKPVILINKYRGQNTLTKEKPQKSSQSYAGLHQAIGELGW